MREPIMKAFLLLTICLVAWLSVTPKLPLASTLNTTCFLLALAYFVVATSGSIIDKTDRLTIELYLAKPFSRSGIILADFFGTSTVVSILSFLLSLGLWVVFGLRQHEWNPNFIALFFSLLLGFLSLYCFIILSGLLFRNVSVVVIMWVVFVYFIALLLEERLNFVYTQLPQIQYRVLFDGIYYLLPRLFGIYKSFSAILTQTSLDVSPVITSGLSAMGALTLAVFYFKRKDLE